MSHINISVILYVNFFYKKQDSTIAKPNYTILKYHKIFIIEKNIIENLSRIKFKTCIILRINLYF